MGEKSGRTMRGASLGRRSLQLGSLGLLAGLPGCAWFDEWLNGKDKPEPTPGGSLAAIDAHCHVFNATDLPVVGFVHQVVIGEIWEPLKDIQATDAFIIAIGELIAHMLRLGTITPAEELKQFDQAPPRVFGLQPGNTVPTDEPLPDLDQLTLSLARQAARNLRDASQPRPPAALAPLSRSLQAQRRLNGIDLVRSPFRVLREDFPQRNGAAPRPPAPQGLRPSARRLSLGDEIEAFIRDLLDGPDLVRRVLKMGAVLTRPRREILHRLATLPATDAGEVRLFTPAMVDFTLWLDADEEPSVSTMSDQVRVMARIASQPGRPYGMHPYIAYCPLRHVLAEEEVNRRPTPLELVEDAVLNRGFIGVKLYPPLGFLPLGNAELSGEDATEFPDKLLKVSSGRPRPDALLKLDRALMAIYQLCEKHDVPIITHTSYSQYPRKTWGLRARPRNWRKVLDQFRNLRLNLGHLGGIWSLTDKGAVTHDWPTDVVEMLAEGRYPNLYTDMADYYGVTAQGGEAVRNGEILSELGALLRQRPDARNRLIYGTDYMFNLIGGRPQDYFGAMKGTLTAPLGLNDSQLRGFMGSNAAAFLGISARGGVKPNTRKRLEEFYDQLSQSSTYSDADTQAAKARLRLWDEPGAPIG